MSAKTKVLHVQCIYTIHINCHSKYKKSANYAKVKIRLKHSFFLAHKYQKNSVSKSVFQCCTYMYCIL